MPTSLLYAFGPIPPREKQWEQVTEGNHLREIMHKGNSTGNSTGTTTHILCVPSTNLYPRNVLIFGETFQKFNREGRQVLPLVF
jgi:hypothetical protein